MSWVAANGLFGAILAGGAMIWRGVLPLVSTDKTSVANWFLSFTIYVIGSWITLFCREFDSNCAIPRLAKGSRIRSS